MLLLVADGLYARRLSVMRISKLDEFKGCFTPLFFGVDELRQALPPPLARGVSLGPVVPPTAVTGRASAAA